MIESNDYESDQESTSTEDSVAYVDPTLTQRAYSPIIDFTNNDDQYEKFLEETKQHKSLADILDDQIDGFIVRIATYEDLDDALSSDIRKFTEKLMSCFRIDYRGLYWYKTPEGWVQETSHQFAGRLGKRRITILHSPDYPEFLSRIKFNDLLNPDFKVMVKEKIPEKAENENKKEKKEFKFVKRHLWSPFFYDLWIRNFHINKITRTYDKCPPDTLNLFTGFKATITKEDPELNDMIRTQLDVITGGDGEEMENWFAFCVQFPSTKTKTAFMLEGEEGCGKSVISEFFGRHVLGPNEFACINSEETVMSEFNTQYAGKKFVLCEEFNVTKRTSRKMKDLITNTHTYIKPKGKDPIPIPNATNIILNNNDLTGTDLSGKARRMNVKRCNPGKDHSWFVKLTKKMGIYDRWPPWKIEKLAHIAACAWYTFLMHKDISKYDPEQFVATSFKKDLQGDCRDPIDLFCQTKLDEYYEKITSKQVMSLFPYFSHWCESMGLQSSIKGFTRKIKKFASPEKYVFSRDSTNTTSISKKIKKEESSDEDSSDKNTRIID